MDSQDVGLDVAEDIAEAQKLLAVATRPIVRDRLLQLLGDIEQVSNCLMTTCSSSESSTNSGLCV